MTTARLWLYLAVALPVLGSLLASLPSVDLAYHLRAGAGILATGSIPTTDTYTFTAAGRPWADQNWGAQAILATTFDVAGWTGLVVLRAAIAGLAFGFLLAAARARGASDRTAALLTLAAFGVSAGTLALRPQLFGIAIFATLLYLLAVRRERPRLLWLAVPLIVAWANLHGSFVLGIGIVGLAWIEDLASSGSTARRHGALAVAGVAAVATLLNPLGPELWRYATGIATNPLITTRITEWQPTRLASAEGLAFYGSGLAVAVAVARRRAVVTRPTLLTLAVFLAFGVLAIRGLAWWPFVAAVTVAGLMRDERVAATGAATDASPDVRPAPERFDPPIFRRLNALIAVAVAIAAVALLPAWRPVDPGLRAPSGVVSLAPSGITGALRDLAGPDDRLFAPQPWGSWFEFAVPEARVFVDSRIELFDAATWDAYDTVIDGGDGWREVLDRTGVTIVVAVDELGRVPLTDRLDAEPGWRAVHADADGTIFVREGAR